MIHFQKKRTFSILRSRQIGRSITIKNIDGRLALSCDGITFFPVTTDRFEKEEIDAVPDYLKDSEDH